MSTCLLYGETLRVEAESVMWPGPGRGMMEVACNFWTVVGGVRTQILLEVWAWKHG